VARQNQPGRTTAKGTQPTSKGSKAKSTTKARPAPGSHRYTPPQPKSKKHSPLWVPVAMFTLLACGVLVILANYLGLLPGGEAQNSDLILGLVLMVGGFVLSTQYR
jgi:Cell division protein CrgA